MDDERKAELLKEINDILGIEYKLPGDVTTQDAQDIMDMSRAGAKGRMEKMVEMGAYTTHMVWDSQQRRNVRVWRKT